MLSFSASNKTVLSFHPRHGLQLKLKQHGAAGFISGFGGGKCRSEIAKNYETYLTTPWPVPGPSPTHETSRVDLLVGTVLESLSGDRAELPEGEAREVRKGRVNSLGPLAMNQKIMSDCWIGCTRCWCYCKILFISHQIQLGSCTLYFVVIWSKIGSPLKLTCWGMQPLGLWFESWSLKARFFQFDFHPEFLLKVTFGDFSFDVCWTKLLARLFWSAERWLTHTVWVSSFVNQDSTNSICWFCKLLCLCASVWIGTCSKLSTGESKELISVLA